MVSKTNEQALESLIEKYLTGTCLEEIKHNEINEETAIYNSPHNNFTTGNPNDFNLRYALDEKLFWEFLESTQPNEIEKLKRDKFYKLKVVERLDKIIKKYGILRILRKGLEVEDAHFVLFYQLPLESSSLLVKENFKRNIFSVTRQIRHSIDNPREEIDMVIFLNGLPVITMELKNHWTGQTARVDGIKQYKNDRDPKQPLLNFGRCIVHFAVDTDEIYMTTKLNKGKTFFLPFNKGSNNGKGNPVNPNGHKTDYLWKEVLTKPSLANLIQHFVRFDGKTKDPLNKKNLFFPRYHQMDVVRKIIKDVETNGVGQTYLIQHSAGSGKSNSITWSAYQLIETYEKESQLPLFDSVIVVTDRRLLDKQIRDNIASFSEVKNIIAPAYSSKELKESLENGKKIIITTIQKFPFIIDGIADLSHKKFAVIIDEAHSSQGGSSADKMNQAMGAKVAEEVEDNQDKIIKAMEGRKMKGNASYLAFTATPKAITLEKFGVREKDGVFKPFHLYSMKQAIEEGFILDVLSNYTTYKSYYEITKSIKDNPEFDVNKAQKRLKKLVESNKETIKTKVEVMADHFIENIFKPKKLKGKGKGMIVTQNIETTIRYYLALKGVLEVEGNPFKIAIAFSGKKVVDGVEHTEASLNGFSETKTKEKFDEDEYKILVVANKYLTGFDQPKLCTMYIDKKLQGVTAVQALSRLNRSANKYGKKTEDLFILDFFNSIAEMKASFDDFYTSTTLTEPTDVNVLHELKDNLDDTGVYELYEIEDFVEKYFDGVEADKLSVIIDISANRFNEELDFEDEEKADFKIKAKQFVKIYGQMASILPYEMIKWEKLFWFLKFLIPKLIVPNKEKLLIDELLDSVDLSTYGLERIKLSNSIKLDEDNSELTPQNPNLRSVHEEEDQKDLLDEIIKSFNEKWFHGWNSTPEEQKVRFNKLKDNIKKHPDYKSKVEDNMDEQNRDLAFGEILNKVMGAERRKELELYKLFVKDEAFKKAFINDMKRMILKTKV